MKLPDLTVVVTDGAGLIGSFLSERLCRSRCRVIVADDFSKGRRGNLKTIAGRTEICEGDLDTSEAIWTAAREAPGLHCGCQFKFLALPQEQTYSLLPREPTRKAASANPIFQRITFIGISPIEEYCDFLVYTSEKSSEQRINLMYTAIARVRHSAGEYTPLSFSSEIWKDVDPLHLCSR